jgi:hypothetical protein
MARQPLRRMDAPTIRMDQPLCRMDAPTGGARASNALIDGGLTNNLTVVSCEAPHVISRSSQGYVRLAGFSLARKARISISRTRRSQA